MGLWPSGQRAILFGALCVVGLSACSTVHRSAAHTSRPASGLPNHFLVGGKDGAAPTEPKAEGTCKNPLVDPRGGVSLTLVRSHAGQGDYTVPAGRYGVGKDELLRVDCATGHAIGIVSAHLGE
jgi:hypothetical protein